MASRTERFLDSVGELFSLIAPCSFPVRFPVRMQRDLRLSGLGLASYLALRADAAAQ
jgi:hypothetical protein